MKTTIKLENENKVLEEESQKLQQKLKRIKPPKDEEDEKANRGFQDRFGKVNQELKSKERTIETNSQIITSREKNLAANKCRVLDCRKSKQHTSIHCSRSTRKMKRGERDYCKQHWNLQ